MIYPNVTIKSQDESSIPVLTQKYNVFYAGNFDRGVIGEITEIYSLLDFKVTFGKPTKENYKEWFQIYNYFSYGNTRIYLTRVSGKKSQYANSKNLIIDNLSISNTLETINDIVIAKTPGYWGNELTIINKNSNIQIFLNNELVETIKNGDESDYIVYNNLTQEHYKLSLGYTEPPSTQDIADAYQEIENSEDIDLDFVIANTNYQSCAIKLAQTKKAVAFCEAKTSVEKSENAIYYFGEKKQSNIYTGKTIDVPIVGDIVGMRAYIAGQEGIGVSHCKRSYNINNVISFEVPKLKELYAKNINSLAKGEYSYFANTEICSDNGNFTNKFIHNRLSKETGNEALNFVFEFNDEITRSNFKNKIAVICEKYKMDNLITDYKIICEISNQNLSEPNGIYLDIIYKPNNLIQEVKINLKSITNI